MIQATLETDDAVQEAVDRSIRDDKRIDSSDIIVKVSRGKALLKGSVGTYAESRFAEIVAGMTRGVRSIDNRLSVRHMGKVPVPTDIEIETAIRDILASDLTIADPQLNVTVNAGMVTLEGTVDEHWHRLRAQEIVEEVSGVISVNNRLVIVPTGTDEDRALALRIIAALKSTACIVVSALSVYVEDGAVTLSGTVPDRRIYRSVEDAVYRLPGVTGVTNHMMIER